MSDEQKKPQAPTLARKISASELESVPEDYRPAYVENEDGPVLTLDHRIVKVIRDGLAEIERLEAGIADVAQKRTALASQNYEARITEALDGALTEAGVRPRLLRAATALLREQHKLEVEDADNAGGYVVMAHTEHGLHSLGYIVNNWLYSEDGKAFRANPNGPGDGHFGGLLADLKRRR